MFNYTVADKAIIISKFTTAMKVQTCEYKILQVEGRIWSLNDEKLASACAYNDGQIKCLEYSLVSQKHYYF